MIYASDCEFRYGYFSNVVGLADVSWEEQSAQLHCERLRILGCIRLYSKVRDPRSVQPPVSGTSHQGASAPSEFHWASGFPALLPKRDSCESALWYPPDGSSRVDHVRQLVRGDLGMNQRLRPLSCFLTLAVLAICSTDAAARSSHKHQHGKKSHEAGGARHHRHAALKKARHAKHIAAAQRKSTHSSDAPPSSADTPPLSGDLAAVKDAIDLARKAKTSEA